MGHLTLIVGGVRSGKSRLAETLAGAHPPVTYLATAQAGDEEMAGRIARHRQRREALQPPWQTVEEPWAVARVVAAQAKGGCLLLECLPLWLTNLLLGLPARPGLGDAELQAQVAELADAARSAKSRVIIVSGEVGCGVLPINALARRFADLLGEANQQLAAAADEVYACVAGIPLRIK